MMVPGHLGLAYLLAVLRVPARPPDLTREVLPALLGALTPDLIDKPLLLAGVFVHGRSIGHSLTFLFAGLAAGVLARRRAWRVAGPLAFWVLGVASHLGADFADDLVSGLLSGSHMASTWFLWPLATPSTWEVQSGIALLPGYTGWTPLEWLTIALALVVAGSLGALRTGSGSTSLPPGKS